MMTDNIGTKSLRNSLKDFTKPFHDALESTSLAKELLCGTIDKTKYITYLQSLHAIHENIENRIKNMNEWELYNINPHNRCRLHLIEKDLSVLESSPKRNATRVYLNTQWSFSCAVGVLYVLEGSTMGGRLLAQRLEHMCGGNGLRATSYFESYQDDTLILWREYCEFLSNYEKENPEESSRVILSACDMFLVLLEIMNELD